VAFEVGASVGMQTLKLAKYVGPRGSVRAVEADPQRWAVLRENFVANRIINVELFCHAIGSEDHAIPVPKYGWEAKDSVARDSKVAVVALHSMANTRIDFLRVAGLGRHMSVLRSAHRLLQIDLTIIYLIDAPIDDAELYNYLSEAGYRWQRHVVPWVKSHNAPENLPNIFANGMEYNLICVPHERAGENMSGFRVG
jgi:FkbM family methyltransferase